MDDETVALAAAPAGTGVVETRETETWPEVDAALDDLERPLLIAEIARLRRENARLFEKSCHLEVGLRSSREIGAALGIVMVTHHATNAQAFDLLTRLSQDLNRKLRDIAADIVLTGALPDVPSKPPTSDDQNG